jgi:hypothetical protein
MKPTVDSLESQIDLLQTKLYTLRKELAKLVMPDDRAKAVKELKVVLAEFMDSLPGETEKPGTVTSAVINTATGRQINWVSALHTPTGRSKGCTHSASHAIEHEREILEEMTESALKYACDRMPVMGPIDVFKSFFWSNPCWSNVVFVYCEADTPIPARTKAILAEWGRK